MIIMSQRWYIVIRMESSAPHCEPLLLHMGSGGVTQLGDAVFRSNLKALVGKFGATLRAVFGCLGSVQRPLDVIIQTADLELIRGVSYLDREPQRIATTGIVTQTDIVRTRIVENMGSIVSVVRHHTGRSPEWVWVI